MFNELKKLVNDGYEDLSISQEKFIDLFKKYSHEIAILVDGKKVWIHFHDFNKPTFMERDISDGSLKQID